MKGIVKTEHTVAEGSRVVLTFSAAELNNKNNNTGPNSRSINVVVFKCYIKVEVSFFRTEYDMRLIPASLTASLPRCTGDRVTVIWSL